VVRRRTVLGAAAGAAGVWASAACGPGKSGQANAAPVTHGGQSGAPSSAPPEAPGVTFAPATGSANVAVTEPVTVTAHGGTLSSVTVTAGKKTLAGTLDGDQRTWRSAGPLEYGQTYTVGAAVVDEHGTRSEQTSSFSTIKPKAVAAITFRANALHALKNGGTYGVGQVVMVHFSHAVKDRAAAEKVMTVQAEPAVEGRWRWIDSQNAHYRPPTYWKPGTKVTVAVNAHGADLGGGIYGAADASTSFTVGPSKIAVADAKSHHMQVFIDGQLVKNMPISMGKGGTVKGTKGQVINYWTRSGVHVILDKAPNVRMTSASYGITDPKDPNFYDENITYCCRITYTGEFVHLADWNIPAQGHRNTSHGCINVGPDNAKWFYANFGLGDVVDVKNNPRQMGLSDGIGDWTIAWEKW
jgi:lipoprotein-anchoring transpeptidase ErfK/SrfK